MKSSVVLAAMLLASVAAADGRKTVARRKAAADRKPAAAAPAPAVSAAAEPAPSPPPASMTLRQGVVAGAITLEVSFATDRVPAPPRAEPFEPTSIAPDVAVGVTDDLTLGIINSSSALTGFRGSAGAGLCLTGTDGHCAHVYSTGGVEALYSLAKGPVAIAADAGFLLTSFTPEVHEDLKLGVKMKLSDGNVFALFSPSVWIALDDRYARAVPHKDQIWAPIGLWVKTGATALGVGTGVKGTVKDFKDNMSVPIGLAVQYTVQPRVSIGGSFVFGKMLGGSGVVNPGPDARALQLWINVASN